MAITYLSSRVIEGILLIVSAVCLLSIIPLSEQFNQATQTDPSYFETIGFILNSAKHHAFQFAMIALSFGSFFLCYLLYKARLIPRLISILGFVGYALLLLKMTSEMLGYDLGGQTLYIPGALFELILPLWLIIKGFKLSKQ